jgi:hypothetical protein
MAGPSRDQWLRQAKYMFTRNATQGSRSMSSNVSWSLAGNFVLVMCQWGILAALARWGSSRLVGDYAWGLALSAPIMIFYSLSLREIYVTDVLGEVAFGAYMRLRIVTSIMALLTLLGVLLFLVPKDVPFLLTLLIGMTKAIEQMSDLIHARFQKTEQMEVIAKSFMIRGASSLIVFVTLLVLTGSVFGWSGRIRGSYPCLSSVF